MQGCSVAPVRAYVLGLLFCSGLFAQSDLATITGIVTDSAGAVIPSASVTIRNVDTNEPRSIKTNGEGYYAITNLPPGNYELAVASAGFEKYLETAVVLEVGETLHTDVKLVIGSVNETIHVTASVAVLNTDNGPIKGEVIGQEEIREMPMNGRDFTELALLVPGVVPNAQGGQGSFASINGARGDNTNFRVDGFDDRNIRGAAAQYRPNIDAMQEFKMEVSGYSAEYGKMAGGVLNMSLKSGSNQVHGTIFEYLRNDKFDSRGYFDSERLGLHQNQFGGTISGPIRIPKVYNGHDRTFYLFSSESYRLVWGQTQLGNVPTALERAGNISQTLDKSGKPVILRNPFTSTTPAQDAPFPNLTIPTSLFNPIGVNVLSFYPLPNRTAPGNNYQSSADNVNNWDSFLGKVDHRFSSTDSMAVRFGKRFGRNNAPWAGSDLGVFGNYVRDDRELGGVDFTHIFSPTLLASFRFGLSRNASREHILDHGFPTAAGLGMQGSTSDPLLAGLPLINITNYLPVGYAANEPVQYFVTDYQWGSTFTWIKAGHVMKWGADYARYQFNQPYFNNSRGTMTLNGVWTSGANNAASGGNSIADVLLGLVANSTETTQTARNYMREEGLDFFFNDDWKLLHNLTINLGLRYELEKQPYDKYDRVSNFIPSLDKIIISSPQNIANYAQLVTGPTLSQYMGLAKDYGLPRGLIKTSHKEFAPRVGFAWHATPRTVLRGGYGIFYSGQLLNDVRNGLDNTFPMVLAYTYAHVFADPGALTLSTPWNPARGTQTGLTGTSTGYAVGPTMSYLQSYNMTVEREVGKGAVVEVGFVGSKGTHLPRQYNLNLPIRTIASYEATGTFPVPYPAFGTINYWDFGSNSIYNAGQITLRKRSTNGFFYRLNYAYSKSIDNNSQSSGQSDGGFAQALDPRNLSLERGRSDWDRGHVFTASFAYPLPVGRGRRFLNRAGSWADGVLGGWQIAGTAAFYTGAPFTIEDSTINAAVGESLRPNRIASGKDVTGTGRRGVDYPWYDPAAFVDVPGCISRTNCSRDKYGFLPFQPGNSGRSILDGPGRQNINLSLLKRFHVTERKSFEFRWETFNIFNHPNFQLPDRNFNETAAGYLSDIAASGQGGPRLMQFALRYQF